MSVSNIRSILKTPSPTGSDTSSSCSAQPKSVLFSPDIESKMLFSDESHYSKPLKGRKAKGVVAHKINKLDYKKTSFREAVALHGYIRKCFSIGPKGDVEFSSKATQERLIKARKRVFHLISHLTFDKDYAKLDFLSDVYAILAKKLATM
ncbi:MAG: hypothetical protein P0S95_05055 [Rhabdochlamydiaceae bacterium]|nr:hypothetical protein [Candidatus Amphrikana amoebophyrae]